MVEIQDLTLFVGRGLARIESRFRAKAEAFRNAFATFALPSACKYGIRATLDSTFGHQSAGCAQQRGRFPANE